MLRSLHFTLSVGRDFKHDWILNMIGFLLIKVSRIVFIKNGLTCGKNRGLRDQSRGYSDNIGKK